MHRVILVNSRLAQRRVLFEVLGIFAYIIAVALCLFNILSWKDHSIFVISCTLLWVVFSACVVVRLVWINADSHDKKALEIPESWDESFVNSQQDAPPATNDRVGVVDRQIPPNDEDLRSIPTLLNDKQSEDTSSASAIESTDEVEPDAERTRVNDLQMPGRSRKRLIRFRKKRNSKPAANNLGVYTQKTFAKRRCDCN